MIVADPIEVRPLLVRQTGSEHGYQDAPVLRPFEAIQGGPGGSQLRIATNPPPS